MFDFMERARVHSLRLVAAALYALSLLVVAHGVSAHGDGGATMHAAVSGQALIDMVCHADVNGSGAPDGGSHLCCDACVASHVAGFLPAPIRALDHRIEFAVRLDFARRLGRDADARPDDLRSRAPPAA